ncbi:MAG: hypothetical protein DRH04_08675 [Deltaproteobacteria bacterium]|nr:MAG: hypothetical protein DRH04_08675 [Deltaproteobacteria bacterium]
MVSKNVSRQRLPTIALVFSVAFPIPFLPLVGAILGAVALFRVPFDTRGFRFAKASIVSGLSVFVFLQAFLGTPLYLKHVRLRKESYVLDLLTSLKYALQKSSLKNGRLPGVLGNATAKWTPSYIGCEETDVSREWNVLPWSALGFRVESLKYRTQIRYWESRGQLVVMGRSDFNCDGDYSYWAYSMNTQKQGMVSWRGPMRAGDPDDL